MAERKFKINEFVWAKLQIYPPWPAVIIEPDPFAKTAFPKRAGNISEFYWVYFMGSRDYSWVKESSIKPYLQFRDKFVSTHKRADFKAAVAEMDRHAALREMDPDYVMEDIADYKGSSRQKSMNHIEIGHTERRSRSPTVTSLSSSTVSSEDHMQNKRMRRSLSVFSSVSSQRSSRPTTPNEMTPNYFLDTKNIKATRRVIGVVGLGNLGCLLVRNLVISGHRVNMWNETEASRLHLEEELVGAAGKTLFGYTSLERCIKRSSIIFICIPNYKHCRDFMFKNFGANSRVNLEGKSIVVMSSISPEISKEINDILEENGAKYLEAQLQWENEEMENSCALFVAGDKRLFIACQSCFKAISSLSIYLGKAGFASKAMLIVQLMRGCILAALSESAYLFKKFEIEEEILENIINGAQLNSRFIHCKLKKMLSHGFENIDQTLQDFQTDMKMGLDMSHDVDQPMNVTAAAHENLKHCRRLDLGKWDASIMFMRNVM